MTTVVTTEAETPATQAEVIAAETVAAVAKTAPEVAQIQADRDVAIAEIQAETQEAAIEAAADIAEDDQENEEWRRNIEASQTALTQNLATLTEQVSSIQATLTQMASLPQNPSLDESVAATPASQEVPEEVARRKKALRWI